MNERNYRMTKQRKIIYDLLMLENNHPTALELYDKVRNKLPNISLGTVYRNLDILHEMSKVRKIDNTGSQMRFDGKINEHYHVKCIKCGHVEDLFQKPIIKLDPESKVNSQYDIMGFKIEFLGLCPLCKKDKKDLKQVKGDFNDFIERLEN
jgi:Fur family transcriptional regulator, ferric uptake regulator